MGKKEKIYQKSQPKRGPCNRDCENCNRLRC